ncbi:MAG: hypothetical protein Rubg2KO_40540 [Rubricoccaceae bacterium]
MFVFLIVVILVIAVLMAIVVLLQSGKGGGLAGIASGGQTTQILGARQAPDFLEKATWGLGWAFLFLCVLTTFFIPGERQGSILQDRADEIPIESGAPIGTPDATPIAPAQPSDAPAGEAPAGDAGAGGSEGGGGDGGGE